MARFLVIAEKPSVAQSYAKNLSAYKKQDGYMEGENCLVSWCLGHLAEYARPEEYDERYAKWQFDDLPIIPEKWKLQVSADKKKQFSVLKELMNREDIEYLVNGCDAGREGELIFQRVYDLSGCRKPVRRLWISSMEDEAIKNGFREMQDKEFDEKTEKKGLGTPATRASTIEKLVASGYAQRKGKQIIPTAEGRELIRVMPENLKSAGLTAEWENRLLLMERGELNGEQFMDDIVTMLEEILNGCRKIPEEERNRFQTAKELIGKCPVCGSDIFEGKRNFYCSNRQCDFALWKDNRFLEGMEKKLDKKMAKELLDKACTHVKGLYSKKKDAGFDADLLMTLENGKPKFHLEFPKRKHKG